MPLYLSRYLRSDNCDARPCTQSAYPTSQIRLRYYGQTRAEASASVFAQVQEWVSLLRSSMVLPILWSLKVRLSWFHREFEAATSDMGRCTAWEDKPVGDCN